MRSQVAPKRRRLVLGVLGAAALVAIAGATAASMASRPQERAQKVPVSEATPTEFSPIVSRRDFRIDLRLDGRTVPSDGIALSPHPGLTPQLTQRPGTRVNKGQAIGRLVVNGGIADAVDGAGELDRAQLTLLESQEGPIVAVQAGRLTPTSLQVPGIDIEVLLKPVQALRFRSMSFSGTASVETVMGQRRFSCLTLALGDSGDDGTTPLRCRLPPAAETATGLPATLRLQSKVVKDAVIVPTIAIRYDQANDRYFVITAGQDAGRRIGITVGATDGVARVVTSTLKVGTQLSPRPSGKGEQE